MAFKTRWLRELKNINCLFLYVVKKIYIFFHYDNYNTKNSQTFSLIAKCKSFLWHKLFCFVLWEGFYLDLRMLMINSPGIMLHYCCMPSIYCMFNSASGFCLSHEVVYIWEVLLKEVVWWKGMMSSLFIRSMGCILCYNADNKSSMETYILNFKLIY